MNTIDWHHAPLHRFVPGAVHIITGSTLHKQHLFADFKRLDLLQDTLLAEVTNAGWIPHAWACFSNHYHLIAKTSESLDMSAFVKNLHQKVAYHLNQIDGALGRVVMYQYWDRCLSFESSYYARLRYVMNNPVKHGLVDDARLYRWCSAAWFHANNTTSFRRRIESYKTGRVNEPDYFDVLHPG